MSKEALRRIAEAKVTGAEELDLSGLGLRVLPKQLKKLQQIRGLWLANNQFTILPEWLVELGQLAIIDVSFNRLTSLPDWLGQFPQLQQLDVSINQLTALPDSLGELTQLKQLDASRNKLSELPRSFGQLAQLQQLDVSINQLTELPDSLGDLTQLQLLSVWDNQLTVLPDCLGQLAQLKQLYVWGNKLTTIPDCLGQLTQLKQLYVWGNQLTALPDCLGKLSHLEQLSVWSNQLTALPDCLGQLTQLQQLDVSDNQIAVLPDCLGQLTQLHEFDVSRNQLTALPECLGRLTQLQQLDVADNKLTTLPDCLGQLLQLQQLYVSGNQLTKLPDALGQLAQLQILDVAYNDLASLPVGLLHLPLEELWLQENSQLGLSYALLGKYVVRYERRSGRNNYRSRRPVAILAAYFGAQEQGGRALNEIKLVLVGRGAAGKTSIARRLVKNTFSSRQKETPGIDICRWKLSCGETDVTVNLWDFAGQVITHATHQFFLSCDSVYVLVLTGREDTQKSDADYWLRLIRAFAGDADGHTSPVIVALNKWEQHHFKLDRNLLQEKYPFIAGFIETDCKSGLGMEALKEKLAELVQGMDIVRRPFKLSWWQIKQHLEQAQRKKHYLPYSEFQAICAKLGEADAGQQRILAEVFHALGIALNYGQDERLRHSTVLNPRWVTEGIYTLLRQAVAEDGSAEMTLARVQQALPGEPEPMRLYLVELMRRFDLAFPLNETGDRWLVPQRLPAEQPELAAEWREARDATRLQYVYPVIPEGLLPRFITRSYPLSEGQENGAPLPRWANGVILANQGARALVRVDEEERKIQVVVLGEKTARLSLLGVIQADFRTIHDDISGLGQEEWLEVEGQPGVYVPVQTLLADEVQRQTSSAATPRGTIALDPSAELNHLSEPAARDPRQWRARVFISYASSDARFKDQLLVRLKPMQTSTGLIECWHDRLIGPGEDWDGEIKAELERADVILLLVSAQFRSSDYIRSVEMRRAMERHEAGQARVIPIVLEACDWQQEVFGKCEALPGKAKPVRDWKPQDKAWYDVEMALSKVFADLRRQRENSLRDGLVYLREKLS